jgi:hypothetical protein
MEKVVGRNQQRIASPSDIDLLGLARERVVLPDVDIELDYQDDVDTLIIRFKKPVSEGLLECLDDETGVLPIYNPALTEIIGIEILDISGQLQFAEPT